MKWFAKRQSKLFTPVVFLEQLANLLAAGVPITRCIDMLEKSQPEMTIRLYFYKMKQQLLAGQAVHQCLSLIPEWFDTYAIKLVALGERTGKLEMVLLALADHYAKRQAIMRKIRGILFYPCMILASALLMTLAMFIFIIPAFAEMFRDAQQPLPWLTQWLFHTAALVNHLFLPLIILIIFSLAALFILRKYAGMTAIQLNLAELPILRHSLNQLMIIRFTRHLALALNAGMPILQALQLCGELQTHAAVTRELRYLRNTISTGASLYQSVEPLTLFPPLLKQMIKTGEESGHLDTLLTKAADILENELQARLTRFTTLLEPLIMVILGVLIGGLVIGMYLPVFNLGSVL